MDSDTIARYQKAREYAEEPARLRIRSLTAEFEGRHHTHGVTYAQGRWRCDCDEFVRSRACCHSLAAERVLAEMAPARLP
jgi:hypothetical protein